MSSLDFQRPTANRRRRRVTISDVAARLGLTKGTVSRALNDYPDIAPTTRQRVRRVARTLGYQPLSHAQAIKTGRARSLGLVIQLSEHDAHRPFLAGFLAGISFVASSESWTLTVATADSDAATLATMRRLIDEHKVDGFILPRTLIDDPRSALLREQEVPFVMFGRTRDTTGYAWYDVRSEDSMTDAVHRLAALGHRRIAFVNGGARYQYSRLRLDGYPPRACAGRHRRGSGPRPVRRAHPGGRRGGRRVPARLATPTDGGRILGRLRRARPLPRGPPARAGAPVRRRLPCREYA